MSENEIIDIIIKAFKKGRKLLVCGNGGSASQSDHFAGEFLCKYKIDREPLPAISLTNPAVVTAIGNDYGFEHIFSRQVRALGKKGDVLIALSTSGKSKNVLNAIKEADRKGMIVLDFSKYSKKNEDMGKDTGFTQSDHVYLMHHICDKVENYFAHGSKNYTNWSKR